MEDCFELKIKFENVFLLIQAQMAALHLPQAWLVVGCRRQHHLSHLALPLPPQHPPLRPHLLSLPHYLPNHHYSLEQMCHSSVLHFHSCLSVSIYTRVCHFSLAVLCNFLCVFCPHEIVAKSISTSSELAANMHTVCTLSTSCQAIP
jgi:hypothetical protein